ncbi:MAG: glycosyltransferase family 4 protein [Planctomycetes bacterium]|nr:glycosyltransferase family 4 protein [Planctomycetota bacterium]
MKILFIHPNMPGQYKHLARVLGARKENTVLFLTKEKKVQIPGVQKIEYRMSRQSQPEIHRYIIGFEKAIHHGQETWRVLKKLKDQGFTPDIVCAHPGWGDALFAKDIYPKSPLLSLLEFYYHAFGADSHFFPDDEVKADEVCRIRVKNATNLLNLEACDWGICPTRFQLKQNPKEFHHKISQLHEGIDCQAIASGSHDEMMMPNKKRLKKGMSIVTYVTRNMEPHRGFFTFMRSLEPLLKMNPDVEVVIVGSDGVSYGRSPENFKTYKEQMLSEVKLDLKRVHFLGHLPYEQYLQVLNISAAHIYLTVPFVLSWSMLEAMAAKCIVIASDTEPVCEVIKDGSNGLLVDFFDAQALADKVQHVLTHQEDYDSLRLKAHQTIQEKYSLEKVLPYHIKLIEELAEGQKRPSVAQELAALYDEGNNG